MKKAHKIAVYNNKGGVGKTTSVIRSAGNNVILTRCGKRWKGHLKSAAAHTFLLITLQFLMMYATASSFRHSGLNIRKNSTMPTI